MHHSIGRWIGVAAALVVVAVPSGAAACAASTTPCSSDAQQQFGVGPANPQRQDTPDDPDYDEAEPDGTPDLEHEPLRRALRPVRLPVGAHAARPRRTPTARTPASRRCPASTPRAPGRSTRGRPDVDVAILDTGIKWDNELAAHPDPAQPGRAAEAEPRRSAPLAAYDCNGDGVFNVLDYECDPRVGHAPGTAAALAAEDLIHAFSNGTDADHNGFVDDIAGWDFFDNDNDPYDASSYFAAANHGTGRAENAVERGNDGARLDRRLPALPDRAAAHLGHVRLRRQHLRDGGSSTRPTTASTVIEGAERLALPLRLRRAASQYAYDHGVVQTFSGDDLNTGNHNYPANYGHAMLIQGTVPDTIGLGQDAAESGGARLSSEPVGRSRRRLAARDLAARDHVLPRRQHDPVRRQELDLDGGHDRLREHRQGRRRGGDRDQRGPRRAARRSPCGPTRCARSSSRPPSG